jgi:hypothetical protein
MGVRRVTIPSNHFLRSRTSDSGCEIPRPVYLIQKTYLYVNWGYTRATIVVIFRRCRWFGLVTESWLIKA